MLSSNLFCQRPSVKSTATENNVNIRILEQYKKFLTLLFERKTFKKELLKLKTKKELKNILIDNSKII